MLELIDQTDLVSDLQAHLASSVVSDRSPENWAECAVALGLIDKTINILENIANGK